MTCVLSRLASTPRPQRRIQRGVYGGKGAREREREREKEEGGRVAGAESRGRRAAEASPIALCGPAGAQGRHFSTARTLDLAVIDPFHKAMSFCARSGTLWDFSAAEW